MIIQVEKRTRTLITDVWGAWAATTDAAPFTDTDLIQYRTVNDVVLSDLTDGVLNDQNEWEGTGVFDVLMAAVNKNIEGQFNKRRIDGTDYATVYLGGIQAVIAQSVQFLMQDKGLEDKVANSAKQREVMEAQRELYERQKEAFDDNKYQKLFEAQLNYNGMVFQDADAPDVLGIALENRVNDIYNKITGTDPSVSIVPEV